MSHLAAVADCDMCGGRGVLLAERIPSGQERAGHVALVVQATVRCARCAGTGARIRTDRGWATVVVLLACIFGSLLLLAAITAGQDVMCATHDNGLRYCPGYEAGR